MRPGPDMRGEVCCRFTPPFSPLVLRCTSGLSRALSSLKDRIAGVGPPQSVRMPLLVIEPLDAVETKNVGVRVFVNTHLDLPSFLELL